MFGQSGRAPFTGTEWSVCGLTWRSLSLSACLCFRFIYWSRDCCWATWRGKRSTLVSDELWSRANPYLEHPEETILLHKNGRRWLTERSLMRCLGSGGNGEAPFSVSVDFAPAIPPRSTLHPRVR